MRPVISSVIFALHLVAADPVVTVYNRNFAVIRESIALDLKAGLNEIRYSEAAAHLEPESVILRDASGSTTFQILEQNFISEPVSEGLLLSMNEGKVLEFVVSAVNGETKIVKGRLIRAGYVPHSTGLRRYTSGSYFPQQMAMAYGNPGTSQPLVEVDGLLQFTLPGRPLFPALSGDSILKPTLLWRLQAPTAAKLDAELSYLSGGFSWEADYNLVLAGQGDLMDVTGWVTVENQSGKSLRKARLKLVAGDIQRVSQNADGGIMASTVVNRIVSPGPQVLERDFDNYHMLTVERPVDVADRETKQIEFLSASGVKSRRFYVYDGRTAEQGNDYANSDGVIDNPSFGIKSHSKVWIMREFENKRSNNLGIALPKGRAKFYRRDLDGRVEFVGESLLDHTPRNEKVTVYTGNAFDLIGARRRTSFVRRDDENKRPFIQETFEIRIKNHKTTPVRVQAVEHLRRSANWSVQSVASYRKQDSHTIHFDAEVKAEGESVIAYTVRYQW